MTEAGILRHMLGATADIPKHKHGYRNRYCAVIGGEAFQFLKLMEAEGLVVPGVIINSGKDQMFGATTKGCEYIKLGKAATKRAMED